MEAGDGMPEPFKCLRIQTLEAGASRNMPKLGPGEGIVRGKGVKLGKKTTIWNYVVIGGHSEIGDGTVVGSFVDIGKDVTIGKKCNIQAHVTVSNGCRIGNNVFIAPNTSLLNDKYPKSTRLSAVTIEDNAIVGGGVIILPGVIVKKGSVVAAGSVVTRDVPARTVVIGVPAKFAMTVEEYEAKREAYVKFPQTVKR
jgi:acetyltransferase-like isoleucine patch superfamily enzyme